MLPVGLAWQRCSALAALIAGPAALLLNPGRAEALLIYKIFQDGSNVVLQTSGSLDLPSTPTFKSSCGSNGLIDAGNGNLCTGPGNPNGDLNLDVLDVYGITGNITFPGSANLTASSVSGVSTGVFGTTGVFIINNSLDLQPIVSSATFNNQTLAGLGFTTPGLIASWQLRNVIGDAGRIELVVEEVPGPLPLFGAAAAFGWSRTLRRRIRASRITNA